MSVQTYLWISMYMFNCVKDVLDIWANVVLDIKKASFSGQIEVQRVMTC